MSTDENAMTDVEEAPALPPRRIGLMCWNVLNRLRQCGWSAKATLLNEVGGLNYRARISDLRRYWGIDIKAVPERPRPGEMSTYTLADELRPRAEWLLERGTIDGYEASLRQKGLF